LAGSAISSQPNFVAWLATKGLALSTPYTQSQWNTLNQQWINYLAPPPPPQALTVKFDSPDYGTDAWKTRVTSALIAASGGNARTVDQWSWYYQNSIGGSPVGPDLFNAMLIDPALAITDRANQNMMAGDWVNSLVTQHANGLSGLGFMDAFQRASRHPLRGYGLRTRKVMIQ
jgi:hypothetical protein